MNSELADYLNAKGWKHKEARGQVQLFEPCFHCAKVGKIYFHAERGTWRCVKCDLRGNLLTLKRRMGDLPEVTKPLATFFFGGKDKPPPQLAVSRPPEDLVPRCHERLLQDAEALDYVMGARGFSEETVEAFRLGLAEKAGKRYLTIPHVQNGVVVNLKYRSLPPAKKFFSRWPGGPSILFNWDSLEGLAARPPRERIVVLCEGETDAMAWAQVGYPMAVSSTAGAGSLQEEWLLQLEPATTILLAYDSDQAGESGAEKAAATLGRWRCKRVAPLLHDFAEMIAAGMGRADFDRCVEAARPYDQDSLRPLASYAEELLSRLKGDRPRGRPTGWLGFDQLLGGLRDGELTVVTGETGSGKSTWTTALAVNILAQGQPVLIAPFESRPYDVLAKIVSMRTGRGFYDMTLQEARDSFVHVSDLPCFILDRHGPTPLQEIRDAVYHAVHRYGVQLVVLDHLHYLLAAGGDDERKAIDQAVREIKGWTLDLQVHIVLVVHPSKLQTDSRGRIIKPTLNNLKGSSAIKQEADNGIRIWRHRSDSEADTETRTELAVLKCRSPAGREGSLWLDFVPGAELFQEPTEPHCPRSGAGRRTSSPPPMTGRDAAAEPNSRWEDEREESHGPWRTPY